jgi:hypothetical protein
MRHVMRELERQVIEIAGKTGRQVSLVGVSLGGTTARQVAKCCPYAIRAGDHLGQPDSSARSRPLWRRLAQAAALLGTPRRCGTWRRLPSRRPCL